MEKPRRSGCAYHKDERWPHASGSQGRTRRRSGRAAHCWAITLEFTNEGDTTTVHKTLAEAQSVSRQIDPRGVEELVADKGYHSGEVLKTLHTGGVRSYLPEPARGKRNWKGKAVEQKRTYENRRRVGGSRGKRLRKIRSELTERTFAHMYETGAMRRVHLQGSKNILKRLLIHGAAFNLSLILREVLGAGTPRGFRELQNGLSAAVRNALANTFAPRWLFRRGLDHFLCKVA